MSKGPGSVGKRGSGFAHVTRMSQVKISRSGMRHESLERVRKEKRSRPVVIVVEKGEPPHLQDGRHRVQVARERGHKTIDAEVRYVGPRGGVRKTEKRRIKL